MIKFDAYYVCFINYMESQTNFKVFIDRYWNLFNLCSQLRGL